MQKLSLLISCFTLLLFIQCKKQNTKNSNIFTEKTKYITNANSFNLLLNNDGWTYQMIREKDTISRFLSKEKLPFKNIAVLSSSAIGYLQELNSLDNIEAVYNANWIYNPKVHKLISKDKIKDAGNAASANLETILALQPDAIITFTDPNQAKLMESIKNAEIPVIYVDEYFEKTPLGKAEYLKLFGILLCKKEKADSLFNVIQKNYNLLKDKALGLEIKPTVFAEIMRGDIWYMPGGNSFQAEYFKDAGANYLWSENKSSGTINLNFEQVFEKAEKADFWMNAADFSTSEQLKNAYKNHDWFSTFNNKNVYSVSNRMNAAGANDYFETGTVRADWVLQDLVRIFHSEINPQHELYFYQKLK